MKKFCSYRLPWQKPKASREDPEASELTERVMNSPTYTLAEEDMEFMHSYEARAVRLQLDYLKAETVMKNTGVEHTIVVFGSARIKERKTAYENMQKALKKAEKNPSSKKAIKRLAIAERVLENSLYYDDARNFGRFVGRCGSGPGDSRIMLMTGGGPGIMEAANRGAHDVGAKSIGLNIKLPHEQFPNPYVSPELCFQFRYFSMRKLHFFLRAKALVVYPGGFGTFDELFEIQTLVQTGKTEPIPVVMVGKEYWKKVIDFELMRDEGLIAEEDMNIFRMVDSAEDAWRYILRWHEKNGTPLLHRGESDGME